MAFQQTPLFQLNLMIFLAWASPPAFVNPIFYNAGYILDRIGQNIPTELQDRVRVQNANPPIPFQLSCSPDLLLRHDTNKHLLPIECKLNSFGPDSDSAKQAGAMLSLDGPYFAEFLGLVDPSTWYTFLYYAVASGRESAMLDTLSHLAQRLRSVQVATADFCTVGIDVREDGVYLTPETRAIHPIQALRNIAQGSVKVMDLEEGEEPRSLYIVPLDPDWSAEDDYGKRAIEERVRASLVSLVGSQLDSESIEIDVEDLLRQTIEVWDIWRSNSAKEDIRNFVKKYAREVFREIEKVGVEIIVGGGKAILRGITPERARRIRNYFVSAQFRKGKLDFLSAEYQRELSGLSEW